ncbi:hypothetical protein L3Q82_024099 [Scortum barcoo]|uniref:Uncharacterized protein n=1 Tax=Scortum barcoo TaxID=214431 RepID=A0ACB8WV30_9TELE|nr:hypothetical protein L3Q82_024099 [Scortum barcoo]
MAAELGRELGAKPHTSPPAAHPGQLQSSGGSSPSQGAGFQNPSCAWRRDSMFSFLIFLLFFPFASQAQGQTFTFPDIFPEKSLKPAEGSVEEMQEKFMEDEKQRQKLDPRRGGVTDWFGL